MMREAVPMSMADTLTQEMILMALVDFLALKYLQANLKIIEYGKWVTRRLFCLH